MRLKVFAAQVAVAGLLVSQLLHGLPAHAQNKPLQVVATFSILTDLVERVGGDLVEVDTLVSPNMDAHNFEPSPEQVVALAESGVIFENGLGFEPWLEGMIDAARPEALRVVVSEGVTPRSAHEDEVRESEEHEHGEYDPHIWHDVTNAIVMVENIRDALVETDPDNSATYDQNAAAYAAELEELDAWIFEQVATLPEDRRKLVTSHDTFGYYADRYGFEVIGTPLGVSTESSDPAAGDIAALIETIQDAGVPAIFTENVINLDVMEQIADNAGVELAPPLYTDALGKEGSPGENYLSMMRFNTQTIVEALRD